MGEPRYSKASFWVVKTIMLIGLFTWLVATAREAGRQDILQKRIVQRVLNEQPFCWNGSFWTVQNFNARKFSFKVKKEDPDGNPGDASH